MGKFEIIGNGSLLCVDGVVGSPGLTRTMVLVFAMGFVERVSVYEDESMVQVRFLRRWRFDSSGVVGFPGCFDTMLTEKGGIYLAGTEVAVIGHGFVERVSVRESTCVPVCMASFHFRLV